MDRALKGRAYSQIRASQRAVENRILAAVPREEYRRIFPHLELVLLKFKQILYEPQARVLFGYFPLSGMISVLTMMRDGAGVEAGVIGNEGFVGTAILLGVPNIPNPTVVQIAGEALRISTEALQRVLPKAPRLDLLARRFVQAQLFQLSQFAACNRLHNVQERLAKWLLIAQDRAKSNLLPLTHEFLSEMLGARRSTVTMAADLLQAADVIKCGRGVIQICDRRRLEHKACECYEVAKQQFEESVFV